MERELRSPTQAAHISALNLAEVIDVLTRIYGRSAAATMDALQLLEAGGLRIVPVDADLGAHAGELHARLYDRRSAPLSMADCVALATAMSLNEPLATSDPPLALAAQNEGVEVVRLGDSRVHSPPQ